MKAGDAIPEALLARPVAGVNLVPGNLRDQLGPDPTLLVFLRHFGCVFCRETLADLRAASEADPRFPRTLFFFQGTPLEGKAFLRRYWPQASAISDPDEALYEGFGIVRGGLLKMFGPEIWTGGTRAAAKGHRNGRISGDIWRMPGAFLTRDDRITWAHEYRHVADHPDYDDIRNLACSV